MKFRTEYNSERGPFGLDPGRKIIAIGSCFAENIVRRMNQSLWEAENPVGTLFNPFSIELMLNLAISSSSERMRMLEEKIFQVKDVWHSWWFDTKFSSTDRSDLLKKCNESIEMLQTGLSEAEVLIVTFGTARCYCHKNEEI